MRQTTKLILFLIIVNIFLLTACGGGTVVEGAPPSADHIVTFNADGIAVLRGYLNGGFMNPPSNGRPNMVIFVNVPAKVDGIKGSVRIPVTMLYETVVSSSTVNQRDLRDYLIFNPSSSVFTIFKSRGRVLVEATFRKNGAAFEAVSVHEVKEKFTLFKKWSIIDGLFHKNASGQLVAGGEFQQAHKDADGTVQSWVFQAPIQVQGVQTEVILGVQSTPSTRIINSQGTFDRTAEAYLGLVQIIYTRRGGSMIAKEITELR